MQLLLVIAVLPVAAFVALPAWPYSVRWGYYPSGACGLLALAIAVLVLIGRL